VIVVILGEASLTIELSADKSSYIDQSENESLSPSVSRISSSHDRSVIVQAINQCTCSESLSSRNIRLDCNLSLLHSIIQIPTASQSTINYTYAYDKIVAASVSAIRGNLILFIRRDILDYFSERKSELSPDEVKIIVSGY
jgi:hypothetical protein